VEVGRTFAGAAFTPAARVHALALALPRALLAKEAEKASRADATYSELFASTRDLVAMRVGELQAAQNAREIVEERYLAAHDALFPQLAKAWQRQRQSTDQIADLALRLGEIHDVLPILAPDLEALSTRTAELVADLVEPAKADALEKLGEGRQALGIASASVRSKLGV
jgi:hypothetical protein